MPNPFYLYRPIIAIFVCTSGHIMLSTIWKFSIIFQVIDAAKRREDVLVQVGLEYRYMPPIAKLIDVVKGGVLGQVKMVAIREHRFPFLVKVFSAIVHIWLSPRKILDPLCCRLLEIYSLYGIACIAS